MRDRGLTLRGPRDSGGEKARSDSSLRASVGIKADLARRNPSTSGRLGPRAKCLARAAQPHLSRLCPVVRRNNLPIHSRPWRRATGIISRRGLRL